MSAAENMLKETGDERYTQLGDIRNIPRLVKLRNDILSADYHLCSQKASLMTQYFKENRKTNWLVKTISGIHYRFFKSSLDKTNKQIPQKKFQIALNTFLNSYYVKNEGLTKAQTQQEFAKALGFILDNMELKVYDHELIVGNPSLYRVGAPIHPDLGGLLMLPEIDTLSIRPRNPMKIEPEQVRELKEDIFPFWFNKSVFARIPLYSDNPDLFNTLLDGSLFILTQFSGISHVTPDYPTVLKLGFKGIKDHIQNCLEQTQKERDKLQKIPQKVLQDTIEIETLEKKILFYKAGLIVSKSAIDYGNRWRLHLESQAENESDIKRKEELLLLADMFSRIPAEPPATFYEAVQTVFITHVILHYENFQHGISFGRMDQYLYPFYKQDFEQGKITPERAVEILGCFLCKAGELLPLFFDRATEYFSGLSSASGITLGGASQDGQTGENDISYLMLLAYDQVRLRQPNFHVRIHENSPKDFVNLCCNVLKRGGGLPAFFNDQEIIQSLSNTGISSKDAKDYSIVGCVEWGCPGKSFPAAGASFLNLPMALVLALHNGSLNQSKIGPATGSLDKLLSMDNLLSAFQTQLSCLVDGVVEGNNAIEITHGKHRPTPLLSIIVGDCIENGIEINDGGARYNTTGCQGVGLADVVDSLVAIQQLVFEEKRVTLRELVNAIDTNFEKQEALRAYILNKVPKYGENKEPSNHYVKMISKMYTGIVSSRNNPRKGSYLPGFWSMTTHQGFGKRMSALPSGRLSGQPLANGASSYDGNDRLGPTASMASASFLDKNIGNGFALNQKLNPDYIKGETGNVLIDGLIRGYFQKGGMQVQFNVIDPGVLVQAKKYPEKHRDLVVRVSGYSAYFNDLTESMKDELINRTMHCLAENGCC